MVDKDKAAAVARPPRRPFRPPSLSSLPRANWITNGGSISNQRYSPLAQVNTGNVAGLKGLWHIHLGSGIAGKYSGEAQPLFYKERHLRRYRRGRRVRHRCEDRRAQVDLSHKSWTKKIATICCGWTSRGLALGDGKVYVGQLDGKLVALDQGDGSS